MNEWRKGGFLDLIKQESRKQMQASIVFAGLAYLFSKLFCVFIKI